MEHSPVGVGGNDGAPTLHCDVISPVGSTSCGLASAGTGPFTAVEGGPQASSSWAQARGPRGPAQPQRGPCRQEASGCGQAGKGLLVDLNSGWMERPPVRTTMGDAHPKHTNTPRRARRGPRTCQSSRWRLPGVRPCRPRAIPSGGGWAMGEGRWGAVPTRGDPEIPTEDAVSARAQDPEWWREEQSSLPASAA